MACPSTGDAPSGGTSSTPSTPAVPPSSSALLQCLSQLDVHAWASVLLPKLVADGSAGSVAATCSQLRALCHSCVKRLDLQQLASPDNPAGHIEQWTQALGERFPNCTCVDLLLGKAIHREAPSVLGALASLPKLARLNIQTQDIHASHATYTATPLLLLRHLPRLRHLALDFGNSTKRFYISLVWQQLGLTTQLTGLELRFGAEDASPFDARGLSQLSQLTGLQSLTLCSTAKLDDPGPAKPGRWGFLPHLTALTALNITLGWPDDVAMLGGCTSLVSLVAKGVGPEPVSFQLQPASWAAVGQLTRLAELQLWVVDLAEDEPIGFEPAIAQLTRLQVFACSEWTSKALPALQGLPALTHVLGYWGSLFPVESDGEQPVEAHGVKLPQVRTLSAAGGAVPFCAFPGLEEFGQRSALPAARLASLAARCPNLRRWWVEADEDGDHSTTLWRMNALRSRVTALQSLTALQHLTHMEFSPVCDAEVLALVPVAERLLRSSSLQQLRVVVPDVSVVWRDLYKGCCCSSLTHFARLSGLRELQLELLCSNGVCASAWEAAALLDAFRSFAGSVSIAGHAAQLSLFEEGQQLLCDNSLGVSRVKLICLGADRS